MISRRIFIAALTVGALVACASFPMADPENTVYLVRHAEKEKGKDPDLTDAGQMRAERLATRLSDADLTHIWSSPYKRTWQTAEKVATMTGLEIQSYDPRDLDGFSMKLKAMPGRHLVVGHSNTTPTLVDLLGDDPEPTPIIEETEYDRLYTVYFFADQTDTLLERY